MRRFHRPALIAVALAVSTRAFALAPASQPSRGAVPPGAIPPALTTTGPPIDLWLAFAPGRWTLPLPGPACAVLGGGHTVAIDGATGALVLQGDPQTAIGTVASVFTAEGGGCAAPLRREVRLHLVAPLPAPSARGTATLYLDEHRLDVSGSSLRGDIIRVRRADHAGWIAGRCDAPAPAPGGETCSIALGNSSAIGATSSPGDIQVVLWPAGTDLAAPAEAPLFADGGRRVDAGELQVPVARMVIDDPLLGGGAIELSREVTRLAIRVPGSLAAVSCPDAQCSLEDGSVSVSQTDPDVSALRIDLTLRAGLYVQHGGVLTGDESVSVPVVRCNLTPLGSLGLLAGAEGERLFIVLGTECPSGSLAGYQLATSPPTDITLVGVRSGVHGQTVIESRIESVPIGTATLSVRLERVIPDHTVVGVAVVPVAQRYLPQRVSLTLPDVGAIPFIPTNRDARVEMSFPNAKAAESLELEPSEGVYTVRRSPSGGLTVRGLVAGSGVAPLRFAYVPPDVQRVLGEREVLAEVETDFQVRTVESRVPAPIADPAHPLIRVRCREDGVDKNIPPGSSMEVAWSERNSCVLLIDRTAIPMADGAQRLRIRAEIDRPNGGALDEGKIDELIQVEPSSGTESIALPAGTHAREFDRLEVNVSHDYASDFYLLPGTEIIGPSVNYAAILGQDRYRLLATTSVPYALYRVSEGNYRGSVSYSAGALLRLAFLNHEGHEFWSVGEFGVFATGLSSPNTNLSFVTGVAVSIPIFNVNQSTQTSIDLHAWLEYSPTATGTYMQGNTLVQEHPFAFIIGPSISIGDIGTNF